MHKVVEQLKGLEDSLNAVARGAFADEVISELSNADLAELLVTCGRMQRRIEGMQIESTVMVVERSAPMYDDRITLAYGCSTPADLLRMLTLCDTHAARRMVRAARWMRRERSVTEGCFLPAYPRLRDAMVAGDIGVAGLVSAIAPLEQSGPRILEAELQEADRQLGAFARGIDSVTDSESDAVSSGPLPTPEELGLLSQVLVAYLDQDGAEPEDQRAARRRGLSIGALREGTVPVRGELLPEVAGQLQLLLDAQLNPRVEAPEEAPGVHFVPSDELPDEDLARADSRTRTQKQHDAFAAILNAAASSNQMPTLGGAAPTLVVAIDAADYATGKGWAQVLNTGAFIPARVAAQTGCAGSIQRVLFDDNGRIVSIGTSARIFNALQRRAITLRDGGCIIPGCTVPATWCEIHHVREHADGGPTHTDNGVLLCWWHHRNLHLSEWRIRMRDGVPEVRGPRWWDPDQIWRSAGRGRSPASGRSRERERRREPATA
ncbi:HNH endonuclease signature motif containing protein [Microbacterium murale]|uniref:HNH nuclease domain-containing protein n=1 Tax=Microbacterium murale TaxID=1081040 RepID=A0ABU0P7L8_9MICO|nr:HNH endonuclease signature motif containing protein [Microbacterium murale]MDQ0643333.1 hypothetical protein [Microbacterium murale]